MKIKMCCIEVFNIQKYFSYFKRRKQPLWKWCFKVINNCLIVSFSVRHSLGPIFPDILLDPLTQPFFKKKNRMDEFSSKTVWLMTQKMKISEKNLGDFSMIWQYGLIPLRSGWKWNLPFKLVIYFHSVSTISLIIQSLSLFFWFGKW